jgi:hypothetical protein
LIDWNNHGQEPNTETSDKPSSIQHAYDNASSLNNTAHNEDARSHQNGTSSTELIGETCSKSAKEASCGEERNDGTRSRIGVLLQKEGLERVGCYDFCNHG